MIITPAKFEDDFNMLPARDSEGWINMDDSVILTMAQWDLIRDTLDSLGYGAALRKVDAVLEVNTEGAFKQ